jgi:glutamate-1-semialdehyde 2,1-aminomutase
MERLAPAGSVYQAGTLSGNPVAVAAGLAALELIQETDPYPALRDRAARMANGLGEAFSEAGVAHTVNRVESLFSVFFTEGPVRDFGEAAASDHDRYARFFHAMLDGSVYLPPSGFEAWFLSTAHDDRDLERTLELAERAAHSLV